MNAQPEIDDGNEPSVGDQALARVADLAQSLASTLDLDVTRHLALARIVGALHALGGAVFLRDSNGEPVCRACAGLVDIQGLRLSAGSGVVGRAFHTGQCQIVREYRFRSGLEPSIESPACDAVDVGYAMVGCAWDDRRVVSDRRTRGAYFDDAVLGLLRALAAPAALAARNAALTAD